MRADVVLSGVEQGGPSFEARVFLDNPSADEETERTPPNGYVGSAYVYGYGAAPPGEPAPSVEPATAAAPTTRSIIVTDKPGAEPLVARLGTADEVPVTVVAVPLPQSRSQLEVDLAPITATVLLRDSAGDAAP
jgi:hypothetical protein